MVYRVFADLVVVLHLAFVLFVLFGGFMVLRRHRLAWLHLPSVAWGAAMESGGWICPLTPLENRLRLAAGQEGYQGGFVEHYLLPVLYPAGLSPGIQLLLGAIVIAVNLAVYSLLWRRGRPQPVPGRNRENPGRVRSGKEGNQSGRR